MRRILYIVSILLCISASSCTVEDGIRGDELVFSEADRLHHQKGNSAPYTGIVRYYHEEHLVGVNTYQDGKKHGPSTEWRLVPRRNIGPIKRSPKRVLKREAFYKNTSPNGECTTYHRNGRIAARRFYKNGKIHGESRSWSENGTLTHKSTSVDGKAEGEALSWSADGIPTERKICSKGRTVEVTYYHRDGKPAKVVGFSKNGEDTTYVKEWDLQGHPIVHHKEKHPNGAIWKTYAVNSKGKLDKAYREYYANGQLKISATYSDGALWQWYSEYYSNGNHKVRAEYNGMGKLDRYYTEFAEDETLRLRRQYDKGKLLSEQTYDKTE